MSNCAPRAHTGPCAPAEDPLVRFDVSPALLALLLAHATPSVAATITDPGFGPVFFDGGPRELSGLAPTSGGGFVAVGDGGVLVELAIDVDRATGGIDGVAPGAEAALEGGVDTEGVATDPASGRLWVSDEVGPAIREHDPANGALLGAVPVPAPFDAARLNRSLESLARDTITGALWTANEAALEPDGPIASFVEGTTVRLQRFDVGGVADGQWAYVAEPIPGGPFQGDETSGVVDLLPLPSGELLVLERSLSSLFFDARLYEVDFAGATDTSALASLVTESFVPVAKTLRWSSGQLFSNFEGLALGPPLQADDWSLLLVSDDGGSFGQALYPLRVSFVPEPPRALLLAVCLGLLGVRRRRARGWAHGLAGRLPGSSPAEAASGAASSARRASA